MADQKSAVTRQEAAKQAEALDFAALGTTCTRIDGAQNRAIRLEQLRRLRDFIRSHADKRTGRMQWIDMAPAKYSKTSGQQLNANKINLYQVPDSTRSLLLSSDVGR